MSLKRKVPWKVSRDDSRQHSDVTNSREAEESCDAIVSFGNFQKIKNKLILESVFHHLNVFFVIHSKRKIIMLLK